MNRGCATSSPIKVLLFFISLFTLLSCKDPASVKRSTSLPLYFLEYGVLFEVDIERMDLSIAGFFHPAAPTAEPDPNGLFWGRTGEYILSAIDPKTGEMKAALKLPLQPYNHVILPSGKGYVTHNTLTAEGFTLTVIDTGRARVLKEIKHVYGFRTSLCYSNGYVFIATLGEREEDLIVLYGIDTKRDELQEILRVPDSNCILRISAGNGRLYISYVGRGERVTSPVLEIMDIKTGKMEDRIVFSPPSGIERITGSAFQHQENVLLPCMFAGARPGIALVNVSNAKVKRMYMLQDELYRVVGIRGETLIYTDNPAKKWKEGASLHFYDLTDGKEVKAINLLGFVQNQ